MDNVILEVDNLGKYFPVTRGFWKEIVGHVKAVDKVSFYVEEGETLGLVGESGCGKTTLGRCILRLIEPTEGKVWFKKNDGSKVELTKLQLKEFKEFRKEIRMIFQDPYLSLDPRLTVMEIVGEPMKIHRMAKGKDLEDRVKKLLEMVGLKAQYMRSIMSSVGKRQRIGIARALASNPEAVADEPVSAHSLSPGSDSMAESKKSFILLISSSLMVPSVVQYVSDRVTMYLGKLVELGTAEEIYNMPKHPYTEALMSAIPKVDPRRKIERILLERRRSWSHSPSGNFTPGVITLIKFVVRRNQCLRRK